MSNTSVNVAIAEPRRADPMMGAAPRRAEMSGVGRETSRTEKKSFAETLENAEKASKRSEDSKRTAEPEKSAKLKTDKEGGRKAASIAGRDNEESQMADRQHHIAAKAAAVLDNAAASAAVGGMDTEELEMPGLAAGTGTPVRKTGAGSGASANENDLAASVMAGHAVANAGKAGEGAAASEKRTASKEAAAGRSAKNTKTAKIGARTQSVVTGDTESRIRNISGKAPKVEIEDKRDFEEVVKDARRDKVSAGSRRIASELRFPGNQAAETVSRDGADVPVSETEINLDNRGGKVASGRSAAAQLSRKLDAEAGSDIVRQVKVVLNRSDAGEVRINLRPDNLGRVRVRIRLEDNRLTGRIFVESAAARDAFRSALDGLQTRLVESGFGSADLELAWDDSAGAFADADAGKGGQPEEAGRSAREFENNVPETVIDEAMDGRVNLVV